MVPPPPPPHHVYAKANSSSAVFLHWGRPAFTSSQIVNYTIRCNPVGLQNASLVLYLQTAEKNILVPDLEPNTRYEFAVRLHLDQLSSPWSPVVYQSTLPEGEHQHGFIQQHMLLRGKTGISSSSAPTLPPSGVKVTLIEGDTALVSWKLPDEPNLAVTRYTILYASRKAWVAGEWKILQREATHTYRNWEQMTPGNVRHLIFPKPQVKGSKVRLFTKSSCLAPAPHHCKSTLSPQPGCLITCDNCLAVFSGGFYHLDQKSMTGIIVGVCIALICIIICAFILVCRGKNRKSSATKAIRQEAGQVPSASVHLGSEGQAENPDVMVPMMRADHFIDAKVRGYGCYALPFR
ncbi:unnamed protein product [Oncorhynchus mykiss]|uniref:Fibronectin type-III domain-containing protein n=1 Tax=Oncorhynchus mykiss TaxID=8022 RepID=A0A060XNX1_ONCMY|nr:unnamed protein product [Oncorhynchus mykiss]